MVARHACRLRENTRGYPSIQCPPPSRFCLSESGLGGKRDHGCHQVGWACSWPGVCGARPPTKMPHTQKGTAVCVATALQVLAVAFWIVTVTPAEG